jgi:hypothetical protein
MAHEKAGEVVEEVVVALAPVEGAVVGAPRTSAPSDNVRGRDGGGCGDRGGVDPLSPDPSRRRHRSPFLQSSRRRRVPIKARITPLPNAGSSWAVQRVCGAGLPSGLAAEPAPLAYIFTSR